MSTTASESLAVATCPSCHTVDRAMTTDALRAGADWDCARCGQRWNAARLATTVAYSVWVSAQQRLASTPVPLRAGWPGLALEESRRS